MLSYIGGNEINKKFMKNNVTMFAVFPIHEPNSFTFRPSYLQLQHYFLTLQALFNAFFFSMISTTIYLLNIIIYFYCLLLSLNYMPHEVKNFCLPFLLLPRLKKNSSHLIVNKICWVNEFSMNISLDNNRKIDHKCT